MSDEPNFNFERAAYDGGAALVCGVDEVGRGPLAGPVMAAAVILDPGAIPDGLRDSKQMTERQRLRVAELLEESALVSIGEASVEEIDRHNILRASHLAMVRAVAGLVPQPDFALIDGNQMPRDFPVKAQCIVKGDRVSQSIAAASIVAKIRRDCVMRDLAQQFPGYGWETNVGYPTAAHKKALQDLGVTPHHRRSFKPVHNML